MLRALLTVLPVLATLEAPRLLLLDESEELPENRLRGACFDLLRNVPSFYYPSARRSLIEEDKVIEYVESYIKRAGFGGRLVSGLGLSDRVEAIADILTEVESILSRTRYEAFNAYTVLEPAITALISRVYEITTPSTGNSTPIMDTTAPAPTTPRRFSFENMIPPSPVRPSPSSLHDLSRSFADSRISLTLLPLFELAEENPGAAEEARFWFYVQNHENDEKGVYGRVEELISRIKLGRIFESAFMQALPHLHLSESGHPTAEALRNLQVKLKKASLGVSGMLESLPESIGTVTVNEVTEYPVEKILLNSDLPEAMRTSAISEYLRVRCSSLLTRPSVWATPPPAVRPKARRLRSRDAYEFSPQDSQTQQNLSKTYDEFRAFRDVRKRPNDT